MLKFLLIAPILMLFSCNMYRIAEKHINKKMDKAQLSLSSCTLNGDYIEYWDSKSEKPAIILVHGFGATAKYQWFKQVEWLSEHYRVIIPNLFHFGNTKPGTEKFAVEDQVEMLHQLVQFLRVDNYTLCGVSYGGLIAMELAHEHQNEIEKLVIFDAPIKYMSKVDLDRIKLTFNVASIEDLFVPDSPKGLKTLMYLATNSRSIIPAGWLKEFHEEVYAGNSEDKRALITHLIDSLEVYAQKSYSVDIPTLLIWGSDDNVVPSDRAPMLKRHIGETAQLVIIKKGAHMPNLTKTKKFDRALQAFLFDE